MRNPDPDETPLPCEGNQCVETVSTHETYKKYVLYIGNDVKLSAEEKAKFDVAFSLIGSFIKRYPYYKEFFDGEAVEA